MYKTATLIFSFFCLIACNQKSLESSKETFSEDTIQTGNYTLATYTSIKNTPYLVVFESALGEDHSVWYSKEIAQKIAEVQDVVLYDRAGYGKSTIDDSPRMVTQLSDDLKKVIDKYAGNRKVILVGHSLGGMIIRDYAIKNPAKVKSMLFVDPAHENYYQLSPVMEEDLTKSFIKSHGNNSGAAREANELIENLEYMATLPKLPNVPVVVLTSIKSDANHTIEDRQKWYIAHDSLVRGVSDFTHLSTAESGHYIMKDEPRLVLENIKILIAK